MRFHLLLYLGIFLSLIACKEQMTSAARVSNVSETDKNKDLRKYHIKPNTTDDEIIKKMEAAKLVDVENPEVYNLLGITYSNKNNYNKALENYLKVVQLRPDNIGDYNNVGTTYMGLDDGRNAIKYLNKGLDLCNSKPQDYNCIDLIQNIASTYYACKVNAKKSDDRAMVIKYAEEGLKKVSPSSDPLLYTRFIFLIGEVHNNIDNSDNIQELEKALRYYKEVMKFKESPWHETSSQNATIIENNLKILKKR